MKVMSIKQKTKRNGVSLWIYVLLVLGAATVYSFVNPPEKEYTFKATLTTYAKGDKWISIAKQALSKSDLPAKDVSMILDSLSEYQNKIATQINLQLEADKKLSDSTSKKPKQ